MRVWILAMAGGLAMLSVGCASLPPPERFAGVAPRSHTVALQPGNPLLNVRLAQWMYLQPGGRTMVNRATIKKFGVELAQVTEYFTRGK